MPEIMPERTEMEQATGRAAVCLPEEKAISTADLDMAALLPTPVVVAAAAILAAAAHTAPTAAAVAALLMLQIGLQSLFLTVCRTEVTI